MVITLPAGSPVSSELHVTFAHTLCVSLARQICTPIRWRRWPAPHSIEQSLRLVVPMPFLKVLVPVAVACICLELIARAMSLSVGHTSLIRGMFIFCLILELGNRTLKLYLQLTQQDEPTQ